MPHELQDLNSRLKIMNTFSHVPPGFRFHPSDEELVDYYLRKKVTSRRIDLDIIKDVDLYKIEPWDLQELCSLGTEDQNDWYFFSHKDKKYPTGTRTNRATAAGFWKATGRDKAIYSKHDLVGMRKTLVFYKGRAPNGQKSDWIMHEYRLETDENGTPQEEGWVVCRVFKKRIATTMRKMSEHESPCWYDDQVSFIPELDSPKQNSFSNLAYNHQFPYSSCKKENDLQYRIHHEQNSLSNLAYNHQLPLLESPKMQQAAGATISCNSMAAYCLDINHGSSSLTQEEHIQQAHEQNMHNTIYGDNNCNEQAVDQVMDWRVLDKFVASQLSQGDGTKESNYQSAANASASTSSCQIDLWK